MKIDVGLYRVDCDCLILGAFLIIEALSDSFVRITRIGLVLGLASLSSWRLSIHFGFDFHECPRGFDFHECPAQ